MSKTKGLLIINLGTPDNPGYFAVFKYLRQFLMDPKVITCLLYTSDAADD